MDWREFKLEDINIRIKPDLKRQYKEYCAANGLEMSKHLREFIEKVVSSKENNGNNEDI
jgi:antitoxin component of RelBE/YafQ-DinJ toxin-antitoxin module